MRIGIVIPARIKSTRFPNKMLAELNGVPLIKHVYDICASIGLETVVLTDSEEIANIVPARMTGEADNGTERCSQKAIELGWDTNDSIEEFTMTFAYDYWEHSGVISSAAPGR